MTDALKPLPPFEEPQPPPPPKRWYLFVCDELEPGRATWVNQAGSNMSTPQWRRATAEDLERMGYVRKGEQ